MIEIFCIQTHHTKKIQYFCSFHEAEIVNKIVLLMRKYTYYTFKNTVFSLCVIQMIVFIVLDMFFPLGVFLEDFK